MAASLRPRTNLSREGLSVLMVGKKQPGLAEAAGYGACLLSPQPVAKLAKLMSCIEDKVSEARAAPRDAPPQYRLWPLGPPR